MKKITIISLLTVTALSLAGCAGKGADKAGAFAADSVRWADSLQIGGCRGKVEIKGLYPGNDKSVLADSVRAWIGERLAIAVSDDFGTGYRLSSDGRVNGQEMLEECGNAIVKMTKADFEDFVRDSIGIQYEFQSTFMPVFRSDSLLSYVFTDYVYLGGAHGGSLGVGQTFNVNSGERLTNANIFEPDKVEAVIELVKDGLWNQYFKENADEGSTLGDMLIINPDTLALPAFPPMFDDKGLVFTYQQYEIACYADGMPSCTIPYSALRPLMRPRTAALLP